MKSLIPSLINDMGHVHFFRIIISESANDEILRMMYNIYIFNWRQSFIFTRIHDVRRTTVLC